MGHKLFRGKKKIRYLTVPSPTDLPQFSDFYMIVRMLIRPIFLTLCIRRDLCANLRRWMGLSSRLLFSSYLNAKFLLPMCGGGMLHCYYLSFLFMFRIISLSPYKNIDKQTRFSMLHAASFTCPVLRDCCKSMSLDHLTDATRGPWLEAVTSVRVSPALTGHS